MLYFSVVSPGALELLKSLQKVNELDDFYLVGGTALALKFGHRISIDLDFFTNNEFDTNNLLMVLSNQFTIAVLAQSKNSITLDIKGVKVDFIRHNYPLLNQIELESGIKMASMADIGAMKINSVLNRGSKKDFFDIYELMHHFQIEELISFHTLKYKYSTPFLVIKSLVYFEDAELEPDPISANSTDWQVVKERIIEAVRALSNK